MGRAEPKGEKPEAGTAMPVQSGLQSFDGAQLVDLLPWPTWLFNDDERVVYCNKQTAVFGMGEDTGASLEHFSAGFRLAVAPLLKECCRSGAVQSYSGWVHSDVRGRGFWQISCLPLTNGLVACIVDDWTVGKHAQEVADLSEERYRDLVAGMVEGLAVNDRDGVFLFVNPACERLFGVGPGQLVGRDVLEFIPEEEVAEFDAKRSRRRAGETSSYELSIRDGDGRRRHLWVTSSPRYDRQGSFDGSHTLLLDIGDLKRTERELAQSERQFHTLIETLSDGVVMTDSQWRLTFVNRAASGLLGLTADVLLGRSLQDFITEESAAFIEQPLAADDSGGNLTCDLRLRSADGREPLVTARVSTTWSEGRISGRFVVLQDVTEAKRGELVQQVLLRISQAGGQSVSVEELIAFIHAELGQLMVARNFYVALYDEEAGLYRFPYHVDERDDEFSPQRMTGSITDYVRRTGEPLLADDEWLQQRVEEGLIGPYGPRAPVWMGVPLKTTRGTIGVVALQDYERRQTYTQSDLGLLSYVSGYIALAIERKHAEQTLRESEVRFRLLIDGMLEGMSTTDADGVIEFGNPALEQILGAEPGGLVGQQISAFLSPEQAATEREQQELRLRGEPGSYELQITRPDGQTRDIMISASPRFGPRGQVIGTSVLVQDITERKRAEAERERIWQQMLQAQKMESLGRLATGISHDFNNILLAVLGNTELSRMELPPDSPVQRNLTEVVSAVKRGKELVQQVLALGRRTEPRQVTVSLFAITEEVLNLLRAGTPEGIEFRQHRSASSDAILADPAQIHQVLMNLCTNAVQAMEDGGGVLEVTVSEAELGRADLHGSPDLLPGRYVVLRIRDSGPGMPESVRAQIFEPFYTTKQAGMGTGLGLAVVQGIVASHGGMIAVESEPGQGAVFELCFPGAAGEHTPHPVEEETRRDLGGRVLFVDDDEAPLKVGTRMLERLGCDVVAMISAEKALKVFRAEPEKFSVLVTDMTMPGMTGVELAATVKELRPELPVVLCTGLDASPEVEEAVQSGLCSCLTKPYGLKDLESMLASVLRDEPREQ